jgi:hypothetical protein
MKKVASVLIVLGGLLAAATWSESRMAAIYAQEDVREMKEMLRPSKAKSKQSEQELAAIIQYLEKASESIDGTFSRMTFFAISALMLSATALALLWLPKRPNQALEPTAPSGRGSS